MDTAVVLQMKAALALIDSDLVALDQTLAQLANTHRATVMAGRASAARAADHLRL